MSGRTKTAYSEALDWIYGQQTKIERARYGKNRKSVEDAVEEQRHKAGVIADFKKELDRAIAQTQSEDEKSHLIEAYEKLMDTSQKKLNCLNTMLEISSLEEYCGDVSHEFDLKAVTMVNPEERAKVVEAKVGNQIPGFVSPSSHDCVFAIQDNWKWISKLVECIQVHLKNASTYHQFFHDVDETGQWLQEDLKRLHDTFEITPLQGDKKDADRLCKELDEIILALKQWETKSNFMWDTAIKVVPVHLRTQGITEPIPIRSIADYETETISVRDGEDLLLLDNSKTNMWKVKNCRGEEDYIPALACLIPGPTKDALDGAVKFRLQLLAAWTTTLKRIGKRLIAFMLMVFKPVYDEDEINVLKSIEDLDKADLLRILDFIENTLKVHWQDHEGFVALQERVLALRMILEEAGDKPLEDATVCKALVVQISLLETMMEKYKDLWRDWEKYKVALESSQAPELMLICDKWEQLKYVSRDYFSNLLKSHLRRFWKTELPFDELEKSIAGLKTLTIGETSIEDTSVGDSGTELTDGPEVHEAITSQTVSSMHTARAFNGGMQMTSEDGSEGFESIEEQVVITETGLENVQAVSPGMVEAGQFGYASETKTAESEEIRHSEQEVNKTFIIKSVIDPRDNSEISLQQAIMTGIINAETGHYINPDTEESKLIPTAMNEGLIKVSFTTTKRSAVKKSSVGIITLKTLREKENELRPFKIISVKNTETNASLSERDAIKQGVLDDNRITYTDKTTGKQVLIADAIQAKLVDVEYTGPEPEPEIVTQQYAVRVVVDTLQKKVVTFNEAVRRGIIDKDTGSFRDTSTGKTLYVGDAIMRGFLKARKLDDASGLDIDPKNRVVVDKTESIKKKLLKPLGVISAFKKAAATAKKQ